MPLTDVDVLSTLSDPLLQRMNFDVDGVHVRGSAYRKIFELIRDEQILTIAGKDPHKASYNPDTDTIEMQKADSPPDLFNRSILVHECTHAIKDWEHVTITSLGNEAAAYLAQATYLLLSNPRDPASTVPTGYDVVKVAISLARRFRLHTTVGIGARLRFDDIVSLVRRINNHAAYRQESAKLSVSNGICQRHPRG